MADSLPDRLSVDPKSPYYNEAVLGRGVGIRFKGVDKTNVEEYCVSEGWVRLSVGTTKDRFGNPMTIKLKGPVEPYYNGPAVEDASAPADEGQG
ncbi:glutathione peroxidase [Alsobacter metallidurans]|uniref:Glutathione peroxidase n=1 Tax=Alsobacter metallidurans TaxID=340221 RepID=A0A917MI33_9HYPH|nr:DUF3297 family protein [Alsobacter metallidurans]GGH18573.1 glutathione peroxidase [Alsobacter metallidurans]